MLRPLYLAGSVFMALCAFAIARPHLGDRLHPLPFVVPAVATVPTTDDGPAAWFAAAKPYCNALEVESWTARHPAPRGPLGGTGYAAAGYTAACFALAGKTDRARAEIERLPTGARAPAAGIVFAVGHPVADAGDDASAGPIMRLVVEYQPDNYMALYHAGMSEYALGHATVARGLLRRFVRIYTANDGWRSNALQALGRMDAGR